MSTLLELRDRARRVWCVTGTPFPQGDRSVFGLHQVRPDSNPNPETNPNPSLYWIRRIRTRNPNPDPDLDPDANSDPNTNPNPNRTPN